MITVNNAHSIGCIDFGNNNFFEIMKNAAGEVALCAHDDELGVENPDGSWNCNGITLNEFIDEIKGRHDFAEIVKDLVAELFAK